jgi:transcription elongation GreA/GreB family factor
MSRAFVKEPDEAAPERLSELPVSAQPNLVTRRGLELIEKQLKRIERELAAGPDEATVARLRRDQRYWSARHASARLTGPDPGSGEVGFGSRVTVRRDGRAPETLEIVGEDEADPASGRLAWVSPIAAALMGAERGDIVEVGPREPPTQVEVLEVEN